MAITLQWDTDSKAVLQEFCQPWTLEEMDQSVKQLHLMLSSDERITDVIYDIRFAGFPPPGAMWNFRQYAQVKHPSLGRIVLVGNTTLAKNILAALCHIYPEYFQAFTFLFTDTVDQARDLLLHSHVAIR
jgi:hypothetical protein